MFHVGEDSALRSFVDNEKGEMDGRSILTELARTVMEKKAHDCQCPSFFLDT